MTKIILIPSSQIDEHNKVARISDIQVGLTTRGRRFLCIKGPKGQTREFKINDLVKGLEKAVKDKKFEPAELERFYNSIVKFTNTKNTGFLHAIRSFFGNIRFNRVAKMESISHKIGELKRQGEARRQQSFQHVMKEGRELHVYAVKDVDGLISPLFYKDSSGDDKKLINYGIPSGKTAENVADEIIQGLKEFSKDGNDNQNNFRGHPLNEADQRLVLELGSKATNQPEKTKAALVHLILMKKARDEKTFYISASDQAAIKLMKGSKEVEEVAGRLVAQCTDPTTDVEKLKKLLNHDSVKNNSELKNAIIKRAVNVQVINIRSCQLSFINPLLGVFAGVPIKKIIWGLKENPNNTDNLDGIEGLREIAASNGILFPTKNEIEQKKTDGSLGNMFNTFQKNYDEAVTVLEEIRALN